MPTKQSNDLAFYVAMPFEEARLRKWNNGAAAYRNEGEAFKGYIPEEAFQECLDLYNLLEIAETAYGINTSIQKMMAASIAAFISHMHLSLRRKS